MLKTVRDACTLQPNALEIRVSDQIEQLDELVIVVVQKLPRTALTAPSRTPALLQRSRPSTPDGRIGAASRLICSWVWVAKAIEDPICQLCTFYGPSKWLSLEAGDWFRIPRVSSNNDLFCFERDRECARTDDPPRVLCGPDPS